MNFNHFSYHDELSETLSTDQSRNHCFLVGRFDADQVRRINRRDWQNPLISDEIYLDDRLIVGKKARRHSDDGNHPHAKEWEIIPYGLIHCSACYFDSHTENVVILLPSFEDRMIKLAVHLNFNLGRKKSRINLVRSCFKINPHAIVEDSTRYHLID